LHLLGIRLLRKEESEERDELSVGLTRLAVIGYNYYVGRLNVVSGELEGFSSEFIGTLAREGRV